MLITIPSKPAAVLAALMLSIGAAHAADVTLANANPAPFATPASSAVAAAAASKLPSGVLARVNGVALAQADLEALLTAQHQGDTPQLRQMLKQQLIARELFRQAAEQAHYDQKPEVQAATKAAMAAAKVNSEVQLFLKDNIRPEAISDAQLKARYDEILAGLGPQEYKPRLISVADEATATTIMARLKSGTAFEELARQYSVAPSKAAGGEVAWVSFKVPVEEGKTQGLPLAVADALTKLPVGAVTPAPLVIGNLHVIVKLDAKRATERPSFEQARDALRQQLQRLALEKSSATFVAELLKTAKIEQ